MCELFRMKRERVPDTPKFVHVETKAKIPCHPLPTYVEQLNNALDNALDNVRSRRKHIVNYNEGRLTELELDCMIQENIILGYIEHLKVNPNTFLLARV